MTRAVEVRKTVAVDAAAAWATIRTGTDVNLWFPAIATCRREGDVRHCGMSGGGELVELITGIDDTTMAFAYQVQQHPLPVGVVEASIQVIDAGPARCVIVWRASFDGADEAAARVAEMLSGLYGQGIDSLEAFLRRAA